MIGQTVRGFEIVGELGSGGYGAVYRARDTSVNRDVAIKVILPQYAQNADFQQQFDVEAQLVAQLEHPHIVPLYSYWRDELGAFLVMRYIRGGSLRAMLAQQGALPLTRTVRIIEQIAQALSAAHEAGVVHRDLKPDNILIDERGNAYLTDFGIAKQLAEENGASATDAIKGTFAYLSPEQIQQQTVSPQTDIYALGIMLYEMLAGQHPFHNTPVAMLVMKHLQEPLPPLSEDRPDLPQQLDDIIARATAKDPSDRYVTTSEVIAELKAAANLSGSHAEAVSAKPAAKRKTPSTPEQRNRAAMLQNVRSFWIEGVLDNSLHNAVVIDLGKHFDKGAVENPWNTVLRTTGGDETLLPDMSPAEVFDRMNGKLLILGDPGGGKTTTLLELARSLLDHADADDEYPIPVVFNLSSWGEKRQPLEDWLVDELSNRYHVPLQVAQTWIRHDALLLLLDGLDEVAETYRDACVEAINTYRSTHGFVDMAVCSRTHDYQSLTNQLRLNGAIVIQPLTDVQIYHYLDAFGTETAALRDVIARDEQLQELARSPLMLSIMAMAYRGVSKQSIPDTDDIEAQRTHLFELYVQRMFDRRTANVTYSASETRHYLHTLAQKMQQHAQSLFHIEDLQPTWLDTPQATAQFPRNIRLISMSFLGLCWLLGGFILLLGVPGFHPLGTLSFGITGALYGFLFTHPWVFSDSPRRNILIPTLIGMFQGLSMALGVLAIQEPTTLVLIALSYGAAMSVATVPYHLRWMKHFRTKPDQVVPVERVKFSWDTIQWRRWIFSMSVTLMGGVLYTVFMFPQQLDFTLTGAILALLAGFVSSITVNGLLDGFTNTPLEVRRRPNEGIWSTARNIAQFVVLFLAGLCFIPLGMTAIGVTAAQALAIFIFMAFTFGSDTVLSHGGIPLLQHLYLRFQLRRKNQIPRNYARFLDYAAALVLLRKVGGGYIFIHRYLLEYFAGLDDSKIA